jgi:hypothetical protein
MAADHVAAEGPSPTRRRSPLQETTTFVVIAVQLQPDPLQPVPDRGHQRSGLMFGDAVHDRVVGIALEAPRAELIGRLACESLGRSGHR